MLVPALVSEKSVAVRTLSKPNQLKVGKVVVGVRQDNTASSSDAASLIGTKQISHNGKATKLVIKCQVPTPAVKTAVKSTTSTAKTPVCRRIKTGPAKTMPEQKPASVEAIKKLLQSKAPTMLPTVSPTILTTPVNAKSSSVSNGQMTPVVTTAVKKSVVVVAEPSPSVPEAVVVVVDTEEKKRQENAEREKERAKQTAAGMISLLGVSVKSPAAIALLSKALADAMAFTFVKCDLNGAIAASSVHHVFVRHAAFGSVPIRKGLDHKWFLSEEPHMAAVPFFKSLKTYAIQGLNIRTLN